MSRIQLFFVLSLSFFAACKGGDSDALTTEDGWQILFNGKTLDGWNRLNGSAEFIVAEGAITARTKRGEPNTFLATKQTFGDFALELEFKSDPFINSGIQIRSLSNDYQSGKVHGYQVELDPSSERSWTGGIYDEARRGWLYPMGLNPKGGKAFKSNEWNKIYIEAIGNEIKTWVNDVPAAFLIDDMTDRGFIALQVHSYDRADLDGRMMQWRNIRIKTQNIERKEGAFPYIVNTIPNQISEEEKSQGWFSLFDGSVDKWRGVQMEDFPAKGWRISDGALIAEGAADAAARGGDIVTKDRYAYFEFETEFKLSKAANSGIKYFVRNDYKASSEDMLGLEYQIIDAEGYAEAHEPLTETHTLGALYDLLPPTIPAIFIRPPGEWNHARIVSRPDQTVEHWLNHIKVLEYKRGSNNYNALVKQSKFNGLSNFGLASDGHIMLQDHGGEVSFRSIQLRTITEK